MQIQELLLGAIAALSVIVAAAISAPKVSKNVRENITKELAIYAALPEDSKMRPALLSHIEANVDALIGGTKRTRSLGEIGLALVILAVGVSGAWLVVSLGGWWWIASPAVLFLLLLGGFGLGIGFEKRARGEPASNSAGEPET